MLLLAWLAFLIVISGVASSDPLRARVNMINKGQEDVRVYWRDEKGKSYILLATVNKAEQVGFDTFSGHNFLLRPNSLTPPNFDIPPNHIQRYSDEVGFYF